MRPHGALGQRASGRAERRGRAHSDLHIVVRKARRERWHERIERVGDVDARRGERVEQLRERLGARL